MASPAILSNFFEKQWTQNHPQYLSGLSRALYPTTFLEIAESTLKHCCFLAHSVLIYIVTKWRITVRKNEKTVNDTHNTKVNQHWFREYQETPLLCSLCLVCLFLVFLLVVVFVLIRVHSFATFAYRHPIYWATGKHLLFPLILLLHQGHPTTSS